jgi:prevent-host-death family protein
MTRRRTPSVRETVALYDAKTNLSELVERAAGGEEIVIAKRGKPKALLVPLARVHPLRRPGQGRGKWHIGKDFDAPLPEGVLDAFES